MSARGHSATSLDVSLKRRTQNLQLSTSWPADYPICFAANGKADEARTGQNRRSWPTTFCWNSKPAVPDVGHFWTFCHHEAVRRARRPCLWEFSIIS